MGIPDAVISRDSIAADSPPFSAACCASAGDASGRPQSTIATAAARHTPPAQMITRMNPPSSGSGKSTSLNDPRPLGVYPGASVTRRRFRAAVDVGAGTDVEPSVTRERAFAQPG